MEINIAEPFIDLFDDNCKATRFVCLSGRSTGKTETFARKVFAQCDRYKQSFIIVRDKSMYLKSNIWRTMKRIAKEIGVYDEYIWHTSMPLTIRHKTGKYSIDLYGIEDDAEKLKGYEGEGKQLCGIWFEEFGLISSPQSIADVENTVARSMAPYACWLYSGNPKPEANSWERIWVNKIRSIPSYRVFDVTFADIWEMLSEQNKNNIRLAYLTNREQFNYSYLGKPKTNDGLVYKSYIPDRNDITVKTPLDDMIIAWCIGIDVAVDRDKTAAVLMLKLANGRLITRAIKIHDPKQTKHILTVNQQAEFIYI